MNARSAALLQREIETLKEQLEFMESRHETLEAAAEQFRLKAKVLREKSDDEKHRYDSLLASQTEIEESLKKDYQQMHEAEVERLISLEASIKLADAKYTKASKLLQEESDRSQLLKSEKMEVEDNLRRKQLAYDSILKEKNEIEEKLLHAMDEIDSLQTEKTAIEVSLQETKLRLEAVIVESERLDKQEAASGDEGFVEKIEQLLLSIEQRDEELEKSRSMYADLQQELLDANSRLDALYKDNEKVDKGEETLTKSFEDVEIQSEVDIENSFGLLKSAHHYGGKFVQFTWTMVYDAFVAYRKDIVHNETPSSESQPNESEDYFTNVSGPYKKLHESSVEWLDSFASELHEGEDASSSSWLHTGSLFVKAHCESIILFAEMIFAFLCIDFAVSSIISWWSNTKMGRRRPLKVINYDNVPSSGSLLRKTNYGIGNSKSWRSS